MIPQIRHILYATDLSPNSAYALQWAMNSVQKHDARMTVLHVLEPLAPTASAMVETIITPEQKHKIYSEKRSFALDRIRRRLQQFFEKELTEDVESQKRIASILVTEGLAANEILQKADELDCDAIIMGTHGKGIMAYTFLGSTTKRVLRRTRKPVFIIPLPKGETEVTFHDG